MQLLSRNTQAIWNDNQLIFEKLIPRRRFEEQYLNGFTQKLVEDLLEKDRYKNLILSVKIFRNECEIFTDFLDLIPDKSLLKFSKIE